MGAVFVNFLLTWHISCVELSMKKLPFINMLVALSIGSAVFCQNSMEKFPGSVSKDKAFFFDSIVTVWVPPTKGYYEETCEKEWNSCEKKYVYIKRERWVEGNPGYYKNSSKLFLNTNGVVTLATSDVLERELSKEVGTANSYKKYKNKNGIATIGSFGVLVGIGMFALPLCIEDYEALDFVTTEYLITSLGLVVVGGIVTISSREGSKYDKDKAIKRYNKHNATTYKKITILPNFNLKQGKVNSSFQLKLNF